jgi:hypothetical protein
MTEDQKAAVIHARSATAMIRAMGMKAENDLCAHSGEPLAYDEADFLRVIEEEGVDWNAVHKVLLDV